MEKKEMNEQTVKLKKDIIKLAQKYEKTLGPAYFCYQLTHVAAAILCSCLDRKAEDGDKTIRYTYMGALSDAIYKGMDSFDSHLKGGKHE